MKNYITLAVVSVIILASACKKDSEKEIIASSKTTMLTSGSWKLTAVVADYDSNGTFEVDEYAYFENCYRDNYFIFRSNGQFELNEGATKCDPSDSQTEITTWKFTNNETMLLIGSDPYKVEEINENTLRIKEELNGSTSLVSFTKR